MVLKELLKPLKQELAILRGKVSHKYHKELELQNTINENEIDDVELIELEKSFDRRYLRRFTFKNRKFGKENL